jgi:hypothetical protein
LRNSGCLVTIRFRLTVNELLANLFLPIGHDPPLTGFAFAELGE